MTIRHLKIFLYVCETLNMTAAGVQLNMSQPAVSQAIKEVEEYFHVILFERFSKQLFITDSGKELREYALHIVSLLDEVEVKLKNPEISGIVRIGANITIGTTLIHQYIKKYNEIHPLVNIMVSVNNSRRIEEMLNNNDLDFALMEETVRNTYLDSEVFCDDRMVVIAYPENKLCKKDIVTFEDLSKEKILLREKGAGVRDTFEHIAYLRGIKFEPIWESSSTTALVNAVKEHIGIAVVPYQLVKQELEKGTIVEIKISDVNLGRKLTIVTNRHKYITEPVREFIELVRGFHG